MKRIAKILRKLFPFKEKKADIPPKPDWSETVISMRDKELSCIIDEVIRVVYSKDGEERFIMLKSSYGFFYYVVEKLTELDDEEWEYACIYSEKEVFAGTWISVNEDKHRSLFGTEAEAYKDFLLTEEYRKYFSDAMN